jgi:hypothetical protein
MAVVLLARDLKHDRPVALKAVRPEIAAALGPERFLLEIQIAARLTHPHILTLIDSGDADGILYYVMPYIAGESLRDRLTRETQLSVEDALAITRQVASALAYAHSHDVVHRDIKPENILLQGDQVLVADFGIARAITAAGGERLTETGIAVGTPAYMSPEQGMGERAVDGRSDIYSLGCVLYEMLVGEPPYTGPTAQAILARRLSEPVPSLRVVRETVPPGVEQAIGKALARVPADRFATAIQFVEALTLGVTAPASIRRTSRRTVGLLVAAAVAAVAGGAVLFARFKTPVGLDSNLVAVAPFDVLAADAGLWHEGLVDLLSRKLDGAGPLRTVSPTVVMSRWRGRADRVSAAQLGRGTGARLAVFGQVVGTGGDSVRLTASLLDVRSATVVGHEIDVRDAGGRIDRVADSLTVALLRELGHTRPIGAVRFNSLGSTSVPALKAFLQGEQFFRRLAWDSALAYYRIAIAHDSSFVLALRRVWLAQWYSGENPDSLALAYARRAGGLNHGLAPRESLLVAADSLWGVSLYWRLNLPEWPYRLRILATLEEAARRYPDDPEIWFELGEARYHKGSELGYTFRRMLDAFDRVIAADSGFAPGYVTHNIELALALGDTAAVRRFEAGYRALPATARADRLITLLPRRLDPQQARSSQLERMLDTLSAGDLGELVSLFTRSPDSAETAIRLARRLAGRKGLEAQGPLVRALAYRGHLREAYALAGTDLPSGLLADFLLFGVAPPDTARAGLARALSGRRWGDLFVLGVLPWWANRRDTASLGRITRYSLAGFDSATPPGYLTRYWKGWWGCLAGAGSAHLAVVRADTVDALRRFAALGDSSCPILYVRLPQAELLAARARYREAAVLLEPDYLDAPVPREVYRYLVRARVAERLGERDQAIRAYASVVRLWRNADPELQPYVREAREGLRRLGAEPR